ncbi:MAG: hypothetical protein RIN56_06820 [Sporomusaceae bacterium]|nr:hypothetical protein [Sporomusaceae bacterium]
MERIFFIISLLKCGEEDSRFFVRFAVDTAAQPLPCGEPALVTEEPKGCPGDDGVANQIITGELPPLGVIQAKIAAMVSVGDSFTVRPSEKLRFEDEHSGRPFETISHLYLVILAKGSWFDKPFPYDGVPGPLMVEAREALFHGGDLP